MSLDARLRERRRYAALTQGQVAETVGVPRELVSMWETGARVPGFRQLEDLAALYRVSVAYLAGRESLAERHERDVLYRGLPQGSQVRLEIDRWGDFLDRWVRFLVDQGVPLPGPGRPPRNLRKERTVTDARRAPTLAAEVREHYDLGTSALPDLYTFLAGQDILVYRASLGSIGQSGEVVSGAFYNHPDLGYCILVNVDTSLGRLAFTLAHEFCHALFHHAEGGLVSRHGIRDPKEVFANNFAGYLLVPGKELRRMVRDNATPIEALYLASYFRVSYNLLLVRLRQEGLITEESYQECKQASPRRMAERLGLDAVEFEIPRSRDLGIERYPTSVLQRVKQAVEASDITLAQAAELLDVDLLTLQVELLSEVPEAGPEEIEVRSEFEIPF